MPSCVHFTEPGSQQTRGTPAQAPMCDCLLRVILGYDMTERDEGRVRAFEDCCVSVNVVGQNRAVSMPLKDLRKLLDTPGGSGHYKSEDNVGETGDAIGIRSGRRPVKGPLQTDSEVGQTPSKSDHAPVRGLPINEGQSGPSDTTWCSSAGTQDSGQSEIIEIRSDGGLSDAPERRSSRDFHRIDGVTGQTGENGTIGDPDVEMQDLMSGKIRIFTVQTLG